MQIRVQGKFNHIEKSEIRNVVKFMLPCLLSDRIINKLNIRILSRTPKQMPEKGSAVSEDENERHPRKFLIELKSTLRRPELISTLAHELVHLKQFAKNERNNLGFAHSYGRRDAQDDYWFSHWEIEAYGMEVGLTHKYMQHLKELKSMKSLKDSKVALTENLP